MFNALIAMLWIYGASMCTMAGFLAAGIRQARRMRGAELNEFCRTAERGFSMAGVVAVGALLWPVVLVETIKASAARRRDERMHRELTQAAAVRGRLLELELHHLSRAQVRLALALDVADEATRSADPVAQRIAMTDLETVRRELHEAESAWLELAQWPS
jgi:hypothetical protein